MVYLMHLNQSIRKGKCHYLGYCKDENLGSRIKRHESGNGASFLKQAVKEGVEWITVALWPDKDGNFERKLKNQKNAKRFCSICSPKYNGVYKGEDRID